LIFVAGIAIAAIALVVIGIIAAFFVFSSGTGPIAGENYCSADSRLADACAEYYRPACGWWDPAKIQCIKYPCAANYGNECFACMDEKVLYWTEGNCPQ